MAPRKTLKLAKGVRDWQGKPAILRGRVRSTLGDIFERYGYEPLETPAIEREDLIDLKGGGEIQKEIFRLRDQGERRLALRFDHTLPLARFVATEPELKMPFKRYAVGEVFRDGPTQPEQGRYRIFTQCDVDVVGVSGMAAEAELLQLAWDAFLALGLGDVRVRLNSRKVLSGVLDAVGVEDRYKTPVILVLDKLEKIGREGVLKEFLGLEGVGLTHELAEALIGHTERPGGNRERLAYLEGVVRTDEGRAGIEEVRALLGLCEELGLDDVEFDPSLARGLDYYTGTTLEVFMRRTDAVGSAIVAGGRYDRMIGDMIGAKEAVPAVGISFGLERICMAVRESMAALPSTVTELYLVPLGTLGYSLGLARGLRAGGLRVAVELSGRSVKSAMRYADSIGIPFAAVIGENEVQSGRFTIKRLGDGAQCEATASEAAAFVRGGAPGAERGKGNAR